MRLQGVPQGIGEQSGCRFKVAGRQRLRCVAQRFCQLFDLVWWRHIVMRLLRTDFDECYCEDTGIGSGSYA